MKPIFSEQFVSDLKPSHLDEWKKDNGKTVNESIREYAEEYIGRPIHDVIRLVYFVFAFLIFCICSLYRYTGIATDNPYSTPPTPLGGDVI